MEQGEREAEPTMEELKRQLLLEKEEVIKQKVLIEGLVKESAELQKEHRFLTNLFKNQTHKVEIDFKSHDLIVREEHIRLKQVVEHYELKAASTSALKLAIEELLTFGFTTVEGEPTEYLESLNKHFRGLIRTRNYLIQKYQGPILESEKTQSGIIHIESDKDLSRQTLVVHRLQSKESFKV